MALEREATGREGGRERKARHGSPPTPNREAPGWEGPLPGNSTTPGELRISLGEGEVTLLQPPHCSPVARCHPSFQGGLWVTAVPRAPFCLSLPAHRRIAGGAALAPPLPRGQQFWCSGPLQFSGLPHPFRHHRLILQEGELEGLLQFGFLLLLPPFQLQLLADGELHGQLQVPVEAGGIW